MTSYEVHLHPPQYPAKCFPWRCRHPPQFHMCAEVHIVPAKRGGRQIEIDHFVCFGCGLPQTSTFGGNVLVDLQMILMSARHWKIAARAEWLRGRWARIAAHLFDGDGWTGRHERIARIIDPNLTMRMHVPTGEPGRTRMATISIDREYLRETAQ